MLTARVSIGPACAGDGHFEATLTLSTGQRVTVPVTKADARAPLTAEEGEAFTRILLKVYARQLAGTSAAAIRTAIEVKVLDLTVLG